MQAARIPYLRPSGAAAWVNCSGYVAMCEAYPEIPDEADNEVREDGTAAHWLAERSWRGVVIDVGMLSPNNRVCDEEMHDGVTLYVNELYKVTDAEWYIEQPVKCDTIYPGMQGTPDAWCYRPGFLRVWDFKYGFKFVEVWENWQLICYAASLCVTLKLPPDTLIELRIIQPRSFHREGPVRTWTTTYASLAPFIERLRAAAIDAMSPIRKYTPGPYCTDCPGRHACPALQATTYMAMELSYGGMPLELDERAIAAELSRLYDAQKRMEARISGLQGQAEHMLRGGKVIPGWSLEPAFGRERYNEASDRAILGLGKLYGVNLAAPAKPISPAQARKQLPAVAQAALAALTHKPSTGVHLKQVDKFQARKAFAKE
jgi:hypothetical protein